MREFHAEGKRPNRAQTADIVELVRERLAKTARVKGEIFNTSGPTFGRESSFQI